MPSDLPAEFTRRLRAHNIHVLLGALLALLASALAWFLLYHAGYWLILLGRTIVLGVEAVPSARYPVIYSVFVCTLLAVFFLRKILNPFPRPSDKPIFGWHLLLQILFLPASLTLAVSDNLAARQHISPARMRLAFAVLMEILRVGKLPATQLPLMGEEPAELDAALLLLQLAGYVDLHEGRDGWFYLVRSTEREKAARLSTAFGGHARQ